MARKKVIQPIDPNDVIEKQGIIKSDVTRGVTINDTQQELKVERALNHKKGTFSISVKWNMNAITGDDILDSATLDSLNQMMMYQRDKCLEWRDQWHQENSDPNQANMFDGDGKIDGDFEDED